MAVWVVALVFAAAAPLMVRLLESFFDWRLRRRTLDTLDRAARTLAEGDDTVRVSEQEPRGKTNGMHPSGDGKRWP